MKLEWVKVDDIQDLEKLTYNSLKYWGYDDDFLNSCKDDMKITKVDVNNHLFKKLINEDNEIIGFYQFDFKEKELAGLFVLGKYIGQGYGKLLWDDLINELTKKNKSYQIDKFEIISDPQAQTFYEKMGAKVVRNVKSLREENRELPLLIYKF